MSKEEEPLKEQNPSSRYFDSLKDVLRCKDCWEAWGSNEGLCPKHKKWIEGLRNGKSTKV